MGDGRREALGPVRQGTRIMCVFSGMRDGLRQKKNDRSRDGNEYAPERTRNREAIARGAYSVALLCFIHARATSRRPNGC
jgi:hypothetical protein